MIVKILKFKKNIFFSISDYFLSKVSRIDFRNYAISCMGFIFYLKNTELTTTTIEAFSVNNKIIEETELDDFNQEVSLKDVFKWVENHKYHPDLIMSSNLLILLFLKSFYDNEIDVKEKNKLLDVHEYLFLKGHIS